jgi:hypothetical protein
MIYHPNIDDETLFRIQEREYALMMERFYEQMMMMMTLGSLIQCQKLVITITKTKPG